MAFDPISAALDIGGKLIDRLWPDPAERDKAKLALMQMSQTGELAHLTADTDIAKAQAAINEAEAGSSSLFISGWRPFVGWVCAGGLVFQFVVAPIATWGAALAGKVAVFPPLDTATLTTLVLGMLGLGTMRTYEKVTGTTATEPGH